MPQWFSHSGDLGDIIYSLPTVRAAGGGEFYIFHTPGKTTHGMNRARFEAIRPLLEVQPYITKVGYWEEHEAKDHNLNGFRHHGAPGRNLADMHLATHGLPSTNRHKKWLTVPDPRVDFPVIFHRTQRYLNWSFPWKRVWQTYRHCAGFIGFTDEYEWFCREVGQVPRIACGNLLDVARYIAGSKLFVGNSSCPQAIAEGLKHPVILEGRDSIFPSGFNRIGQLIGFDDSIELPEIS